MKNKCLIFFLLLSQHLFSQEIRLQGVVIDSSLKKNLKDVSLVLLDKKDSIIQFDVRSDQSGKFIFSNVSSFQQYLLFISYPGYVSMTKEITINLSGKEIIDIGKVYLTSKAILLTEVVVKSNIRSIQVRGDTTQFSTSAIKLPSNATVEDLLKVLPGLQVNPNGIITVQGKKVKKVLVDGEEFFSDDPLFVTRNLRSEMIASVQVYDKKSDAAIFTGIEDGVKDKVINLKLKQDKNNGIFGKSELGRGGGDQIRPYRVEMLLNVFKGKKKISGYFSSNNIGQFGLGSTEKNKLGVMNEIEGYDGRGLPEHSAAGLHFDNKWNKDRSSFNGDYYYSISNIFGVDSNFINTILPTGSIRRFANAKFQREGYSHKSNLIFKQLIGKFANFSFTSSSALAKGSSEQKYNASDINSDQQFLNKTSNFLSLTHETRRIKNRFLFQQKFNKSGRALSFSVDHDFNNSGEQHTQYSNTAFYNGKPIVDSITNLNLLKSTNQTFQRSAIGMSYSEKLNKAIAFILSINSASDNVDDQNLSRRLNSGFGLIDTSFSTNRKDFRRINTGNLSISYNREKFRTSFGASAGSNRVSIQDNILQKSFDKTFKVWKPFARLQYVVNEEKSFALNYVGNTISPAFQELFPYSFNNTQLIGFEDNILITNSFSNKVSFTYESFKNLTKAFTAIVANYTRIENPIRVFSTIDGSGKHTLRYGNMNGYGDREFQITGFYSRPIQPLKLQFTIDVTGKNGKSYSYINNALNRLHYNTGAVSVMLSKSKSAKYDLIFGGTVYYDGNSLTEGMRNTKNNFYSFKVSSSFDYFIGDKIQFHSDAEFFRQGKNAIFRNNFDRLIWNTWVSKNFLSNNQLNLKFSINDLLNSNSGFSRIASSGLFSENRYLSLQRYFMVTVAWNFTKYKSVKQ